MDQKQTAAYGCLIAGMVSNWLTDFYLLPAVFFLAALVSSCMEFAEVYRKYKGKQENETSGKAS